MQTDKKTTEDNSPMEILKRHFESNPNYAGFKFNDIHDGTGFDWCVSAMKEYRENAIREVANYLAPYNKKCAEMALEVISAQK